MSWIKKFGRIKAAASGGEQKLQNWQHIEEQISQVVAAEIKKEITAQDGDSDLQERYAHNLTRLFRALDQPHPFHNTVMAALSATSNIAAEELAEDGNEPMYERLLTRDRERVQEMITDAWKFLASRAAIKNIRMDSYNSAGEANGALIETMDDIYRLVSRYKKITFSTELPGQWNR